MEHLHPAYGLGGIVARSRGTLARRSVTIAGLPLYAALVLAAGAVWAANAGGVPDDHAALGFVVATTVVVLVGAAWLHQRSSRRFALALFALAGVTALVALTAVASPPVYAIGITAEAAAAALLWWLVLSFPTGRVHGAATYVFGLGVVLLLTTFVPQLLTATRLEALNPVAWCRSACPRNAFAVTTQPAVADIFGRAEAVGLGVLTAVLAVLLAYRVTHASSARRRAVLPIYVGAVAALSLAAAVDLAARFGSGPSGVADRLAIADSSAMIFLPFGFIIAIALTQVHAGAALEQMIRELGNSPSVATIERLVRRVLDDPLAVLAFRLPRGRGVVDRHGRDVVWDDAPHEPWQRFGRPGGDTAVAVLHHTDTAESPSLVNAVGAAAVLALENRRLHQELIDTIAALRASRKRIVTVAAAERRKIERDLHDSTQQELMAVR